MCTTSLHREQSSTKGVFLLGPVQGHLKYGKVIRHIVQRPRRPGADEIGIPSIPSK